MAKLRNASMAGLKRAGSGMRTVDPANLKQPDPFYSSRAWLALRADHLRRQPRCVVCHREDNLYVDHVVERKDDPSRELDARNLQTLCSKHHLEKTHVARVARQDQQWQERAAALIEGVGGAG